MDNLIALLQNTDITVILVILGSFYFYDKRMEKKLEKIDQRFEKIDQRFENMQNSINARFDKLDEKITDIDRRLCRLEGAFSTKDCCMLKEDRHHKIAE